MKKIIIGILIVLMTWLFQDNSGIQNVQAQEVGIGNVIFEDNNDSLSANDFSINELSYTIINLHLILIEKTSAVGNYEWETLSTIKRLEELTKTDIIEMLDVSTNKEDTLTKYLNDSNKELQKWDAIVTYIKQEMEIFKGDMQSCIAEKSISDKAYFDAIERYDQKIMEASLTDAIVYENCIAKNRIQYNAKIGIMNKLVFYLALLQKKYDMLFVKQEIITKNFKIFRDDILPDLNKIDALIKQYTW